MHADVPGATLADIDNDRVNANEVSEGMHALWFRFFERLGSEMACDPADASDYYGRRFRCR